MKSELRVDQSARSAAPETNLRTIGLSPSNLLAAADLFPEGPLPLTTNELCRGLRQALDHKIGELVADGIWPRAIAGSRVIARVPEEKGFGGGGLDAGMGAALGIIPRQFATLALSAYGLPTGDVIDSIAQELETGDLSPDSPLTWALAASSVRGDDIDQSQFLTQIDQLLRLAGSPAQRREAAARYLQDAMAKLVIGARTSEMLPVTVKAALIAADLHYYGRAWAITDSPQELLRQGGLDIWQEHFGLRLASDGLDWMADRVKTDLFILLEIYPDGMEIPAGIEIAKRTGLPVAVRTLSDHRVLLEPNSTAAGAQMEAEAYEKFHAVRVVSLNEAAQSGRLKDYFGEECQGLGVEGMARYLKVEIGGDTFAFMRTGGSALEQCVERAKTESSNRDGMPVVFTWAGEDVVIVTPDTTADGVKVQMGLQAQIRQERAQQARSALLVELSAVDLQHERRPLEWLAEAERFFWRPIEAAVVIGYFGSAGFEPSNANLEGDIYADFAEGSATDARRTELRTLAIGLVLAGLRQGYQLHIARVMLDQFEVAKQ